MKPTELIEKHIADKMQASQKLVHAQAMLRVGNYRAVSQAIGEAIAILTATPKEIWIDQERKVS